MRLETLIYAITVIKKRLATMRTVTLPTSWKTGSGTIGAWTVIAPPKRARQSALKASNSIVTAAGMVFATVIASARRPVTTSWNAVARVVLLESEASCMRARAWESKKDNMLPS